MGLTFGQRLLAAGGRGQKLLALGDRLAAETDTLVGIEDGSLPDKALYATGTAIDLVERHLVHHLGAMLSATGSAREARRLDGPPTFGEP